MLGKYISKLYNFKDQTNILDFEKITRGLYKNKGYVAYFEILSINLEYADDETMSSYLTAFRTLLTKYDIVISYINGKYYMKLESDNKEKLDEMKNWIISLLKPYYKIIDVNSTAIPSVIRHHDNKFEDIIDINTNDIITHKRYVYISKVANIQQIPHLQNIVDNVNIHYVYNRINKQTYKDKLNSANINANLTSNSSVTAGAELEAQVKIINAELSNNILNGIPISLSVIIEIEASSITEVNTITNSLKNILAERDISMQRLYGYQLDIYTTVNPMTQGMGLPNITKFDGWDIDISQTLPLIKKTMKFKGIKINENYTLPLMDIPQKSAVVVGESRKGKTNFIKYLITEAQKHGYEFYVIDRTSDDNQSYSDVIEEKYRFKLQNDDTKSLAVAIQEVLNKCKRDNNPRILVIEESWRFLHSSKRIKTELESIVKDGSKYNCGVWFVTQSPRDLKPIQDLGIIENMGVKVIFKLNKNSINTILVDDMAISENAKDVIAKSEKGECIIQCKNIKDKYDTTDYIKIQQYKPSALVTC